MAKLFKHKPAAAAPPAEKQKAPRGSGWTKDQILVRLWVEEELIVCLVSGRSEGGCCPLPRIFSLYEVAELDLELCTPRLDVGLRCC